MTFIYKSIELLIRLPYTKYCIYMDLFHTRNQGITKNMKGDFFMKDIYLLFCIISLFASISSISISCFIYNNNKKKVLKFFIALNLSLFCIQNSITLGLYAKYTTHITIFMTFLCNFLDFIGTSFSTLFGLFFIHYLFGLEIIK